MFILLCCPGDALEGPILTGFAQFNDVDLKKQKNENYYIYIYIVVKTRGFGEIEVLNIVCIDL